MIGAFCWTSRKVKNPDMGHLATNVRRLFRVLITIFVFARIAWMVLHVLLYSDNTDNATFVLNRFALLIFISCFSLILFYWAERFHKNYYETKKFLPKLGWAFIGTNIVIYVSHIIIVILFFTFDTKREGNPLYDINILVDVAIAAIFSAGFMIYGILLFRKLRHHERSLEGRDSEVMQTLILSIIFTVCFLSRVVAFLYRPITKRYFEENTFYVFGYFIPELCPSIIQVYLSETLKSKEINDTKWIDDLYDENDDSIRNIPSDMCNGESPRSPLLKQAKASYS
eukprot:TRINITY_DN10994_c0_g1_i1.p2 TRINITY_DN10994_c0_g1~~TRINITY_DN10994_c0_g1_i1.p2  ORF type:complete len:284 (+),score=19.82 TRINITY_DN10994_c0_g1_i1:1106-1957(+)